MIIIKKTKKKIKFSDKSLIKKYIKLKNNKLSSEWKTNILKENLKNLKLSNKLNIQNASINSNAISKNSIDINNLQTNITPIFIVGMPRSGTTLVEQIVSSHSLVTGAGELPFVDQFCRLLNEGLTEINKDNILEFRENYLRKLKNFEDDKI